MNVVGEGQKGGVQRMRKQGRASQITNHFRTVLISFFKPHNTLSLFHYHSSITTFSYSGTEEMRERDLGEEGGGGETKVRLFTASSMSARRRRSEEELYLSFRIDVLLSIKNNLKRGGKRVSNMHIARCFSPLSID